MNQGAVHRLKSAIFCFSIPTCLSSLSHILVGISLRGLEG